MPTDNRFASNRWLHLALLGVLGGVYLVASASHLIEFRCPFASIGLECAGCGFTRALLAVCELDFEKAHKANRAFILIIQTTVTAAWIYGSRLEKQVPEIRYLALLLGAFMIYRNAVG